MRSRIQVLSALWLVAAVLVGGALVAERSSSAVAQDCSLLNLPPIDGDNLPTKFAGAAGALQDNPTGFGDVTPPNPQDSEGNELDQMFLLNDDTNLYIGITGNTNRSDTFQNTVLVFIDTGDNGGTATLSTAGCCVVHDGSGCGIPVCEACVSALDLSCTGPMGTWSQNCVDLALGACAAECGDCSTPAVPPTISQALQGIDGVTLDFAPEYALAVWNDAGAQSGVLIDLRLAPDVTGTALALSSDFVVDNSNLVGVNSEPANDPLQQEVNAATATTGFEFAISLASLGITSSSAINVQALLASGAGFISNQSLPPMNATVDNNGGGINCVGNHDPNAVPPNIVDFSDNVAFPGLQNRTFTLASPGAAPGGVFDGTNIPANYSADPSPTIQNNFTCFGDAAPFTPVASNGSELDEVFVTSDANNLYVGLTGNIPSEAGNQNTILVFIDTGDFSGSQTLFTNGFTNDSGAIAGMNGITFDAGFAPSWAIAFWRGGNQHNAVLQNLPFDAVFLPLQFSINSADYVAGAFNGFSADLSNRLGVNGIIGDDPLRQETFAATAVAGVQFSISLSELGLSPFSTNVKVSAAIVSADGFVSNQWLPPLNPTLPTPEVNSATFNTAPLPLAIPDNNGSSAEDTRTVTMANIVRITDVNVSVQITHPDISELSVTLRNETSGRTVLLLSGGAGVGANLNIVYDSEGAAAVQPKESLLTFNDVDPNDDWTLIVTDTVTGQTGTLDSWGIDVTEHIGGAVGCLGFHNAISNPIDLSAAGFPGDQFLTINLINAGPPAAFSSQNVPSAFLPGAALSTQNNHSCFGDSTEVPLANPPGSEMDQLFVTNTNDRLQLGITGNLENNENAYVLLLDTDPGTGTQVISGITSPPSPLGGAGAEPGLNGMTMDFLFTPDWGLVVQRNDPSGPADDFSVFLTDLRTNFTRSIGRLVRNTDSGELLPAIPNGNGSELDQMFVQNDADNLYIGLTSNVEGNGNTHILFLDTVAGGSNVLATNVVGFPGALQALDGDTLDVGFGPDFAVVLDRSGGTFSAQLVDLVNTMPFIVTPLTFDTVIGPNTFIGDNTNALGVNDVAADDTTVPGPGPETQQVLNAQSAIAGVVFSLDRASIGSPAASAVIQVSAVHVSNNGFWSNQTLPGLGGGVANLGFAPDLSLDAINQFVAYTMADGTGTPFAAPTSFNGADIPAAMAGGVNPLATQDNFTGFGNSQLPANSGNTNCMQVAFNDSNVFGVTSTSATPAQAASASTGVEYDIPFADLGLTALPPGTGGGDVKIMTVVTGRNGFLSNQFLPPLGVGNAANLGNASLVDLTTFPGDQFLTYTLVPSCGNIPEDIDGSGAFDIVVDTDALVGVLLGTNSDPCPVQKANVNGDPNTDGLDIQAYVDEVLTP